MVEVPRRAEYADITPQQFDQVTKNMAASLGETATKKTGDVEDEINVRLKALGAKPLTIDHPEMVGEVFRKTDAIGWAMLIGVKGPDSDATSRMAGVLAVIRARQRILFAYIYRPYESPETIDSLRKMANSWTDQILIANK